MRVVGIDPGLGATGYGVVESGSRGVVVRDAGVIRTPDRESLPARLRTIHREVAAILEEADAAAVALEDLYAHRLFPRTAVVMGHVRGVICLAAAERDVEVQSFPPAAVKRALVGSGRGSKAQVQRMVQHLLALPSAPPEHTADALALALTALSRAGVAVGR